jgi:hypothetical protein
MVLKTVFEMPDTSGIKIEQQAGRKKLFTITYGKQVSRGLDYTRAAEEFGRCVFHALACSGQLDNSGE